MDVVNKWAVTRKSDVKRAVVGATDGFGCRHRVVVVKSPPLPSSKIRHFVHGTRVFEAAEVTKRMAAAVELTDNLPAGRREATSSLGPRVEVDDPGDQDLSVPEARLVADWLYLASIFFL